jgi:hypothetical protein
MAEATGPDCRKLAMLHTGLVAVDGHYALTDQPDPDPVTWTFSVNLRQAWVLPSALLQSAGRTWAACVVGSGLSPYYRGSLAGAYSGGNLPDDFGACWDSREVTGGIRPLDCHQPHLAELISTGTVPDRTDITAADLHRSCERLAARVMGRNDPTGGVGLAVKVFPETVDEQLRLNPRLDIVCYIAAVERSLDGTIVDLRDRPIPYSG